MNASQNETRRAQWEAYANIWKLEGGAEKLAACARHLTPDCVYTDPLTQTEGWDALVAYMVQFHAQVPGGHFVTTDFKAHHGRSVAYWNMVGGDGSVLGNGVSYGEYAEDGKVSVMTGFFEPPRQ